jgi:hypothetical protein
MNKVIKESFRKIREFGNRSGEPSGVSKSQLAEEELIGALERRLESVDGEFGRFELAERLSKLIYPKYRFSEYGRTWLDDEKFTERFMHCMDGDNWRSSDRKYTTWNFVKRAASMDGDFAECGVYTGASALFLCEVASQCGKHVHLFDSYEGLSDPGGDDGEYWEVGNMSIPEDIVKKNLDAYQCFTTHKGWIPERFSDVEDKKFSLVHLDVDLYEPTRDSLEFFWSRMVEGGVIVLDDHGFYSCPGARKAGEEFGKKHGVSVVELPTGQGLVIKG